MGDPGSERPAQVADLEVTEIDDGLVVYQGRPERVHVLNRTAAFIFELCSGERSVEEIAEEIRLAFRLSDTPHGAVAQCLAELRAQSLIR